MAVPVVRDGMPLMPTTASRARRWIKSGEATPFFRRGLFCVRLNRAPSAEERQEIAVGIDPGSCREGYTVKSEAHTFLNIQAEAVQHVKDAVAVRRNMRHVRRYRKTPCRASRPNRTHGVLPPSTKARWQTKLRVVAQLRAIFPITDYVVEDIQAKTRKGCRKWNRSFSPLEVGKKWFYEQIARLGRLHLQSGWDTYTMRLGLGLHKTKSKLLETFAAHCVDSWVLANWRVGGHVAPDNERVVCVAPVRLHRRQLHRLQPSKGGVRSPYGSTRSCGFKRGSLVTHPKWGVTYVGGTMAGKISLHAVATGKRLTQKAKPTDITFKSYSAWKMHAGRASCSKAPQPKTRLLPALKGGVSAPEIR